MAFNWDSIFRRTGKSVPRWIVFLIDCGISMASLAAAFLLRYNFKISDILQHKHLEWAFLLTLTARVLGFWYFKTYRGIIRYTSSQDAIRITKSNATSSFILTLAVIAYLTFVNANADSNLVPLSVIIIDFFIITAMMTFSRLSYRIVYAQFRMSSIIRKKVVIFGAGQSGIITKRSLDQDGSTNFKVVAFFDDDRSKRGKMLDGVTIEYGLDRFRELLDEVEIDEVIIAIQDIDVERRNEIVDACLSHNIHVKTVPPVSKWINGEFSAKQIKNVNIEDLLGRDPIRLNNEAVRHQIEGKRVLITGAAGSIGSEIARQVLKFNPEKLILLDQAETPLYELENELGSGQGRCRFVIADVCDENRMRSIFDDIRPNKVFHAAAYKHVPLMEDNPAEAIMNNVEGSRIVADLSIEFGVERFVLVSTDKAVNPTGVMGASKRIAEIYVQSLFLKNMKENAEAPGTRFITTRFGNVLGSNGSVIPLFKKQIEAGGPITVTHPDITRYFMTIPEACELVLEAGAMGKGGEIFIFDMGEKVKIIDLAKNMLRLSGLQEGRDIRIEFTGLRPGEKIHEELLNNKENTLPTYHPKIMIGKVRTHSFDDVSRDVNELIRLAREGESAFSIVKQMKRIVPEYISQNSRYEELDAIPTGNV